MQKLHQQQICVGDPDLPLR